MSDQLDYRGAQHLVDAEATREDAFGMIQVLLQRDQISLLDAARLKVYADGKSFK